MTYVFPTTFYIQPSSFNLHPFPALPGKLAGLTYRPSRECVVNQIIVTCAGGFVEQTVNGYQKRAGHVSPTETEKRELKT
jgi:hypothetical protein